MCEQTLWFGMYKPQDGFDIEDAAAHIVSVVSAAERSGGSRAVVLTTLSDSWVAVLCKGQSLASVLSESSKIVREVDGGCFHLIWEEHRQEAEQAQERDLRVGDVVSVRRIYTEEETKQSESNGKQQQEEEELLTYSCVAVSRAYFPKTKGLLSYEFYIRNGCQRQRKGRDTRRATILGIGIWESAERAYTSFSKGSPAEAYWKDLSIISSLKYEVCRVVYARSRCSSHLHSHSQSAIMALS